MGFLKSIIKKGIGIAGKTVGNYLNSVTGGLAGKVGDLIHKNAGLLGKVAGGLGRSILSDNARNFLSKAADKALEYIPSGKVKDTLSKMNDAAQGRTSQTKKITDYYKPAVENKTPQSRSVPAAGTMFNETIKPNLPRLKN